MWRLYTDLFVRLSKHDKPFTPVGAKQEGFPDSANTGLLAVSLANSFVE